MIGREKKVKEGKGKGHKAVEFSCPAPEAKQVFLVGEFNNWDTQSLPLRRDKSGVWNIKINLPPGRYEYKFFADNAWVENLPGAELSSNPFGTQNFVTWVK